MKDMVILGVDVGATGFKGGLVNVKTGDLVTERLRFETPSPATPKAMAGSFRQLLEAFDYSGPVGVGFPAIVRRNVAASASNIHKSWIGTSIAKTFGKGLDLPIYALNDADAAGIATMTFGTGSDYHDDCTVVMVTIGTGLGGALFQNGELVPNFEVGQLYLKGHKQVVEKYVSNRIRKDTDMNWKTFGKRLQEFLAHVDHLLNPDLIILGGGASKYFDEYRRHIDVYAEVKPAEMKNAAGTVGAALYAYNRHRKSVPAI